MRYETLMHMEKRLIDRDELWRLFCEHYWDSLARERDVILCHVDSVLRMLPDETAPERECS